MISHDAFENYDGAILSPLDFVEQGCGVYFFTNDERTLPSLASLVLVASFGRSAAYGRKKRNFVAGFELQFGGCILLIHGNGDRAEDFPRSREPLFVMTEDVGSTSMVGKREQIRTAPREVF